MTLVNLTMVSFCAKTLKKIFTNTMSFIIRRIGGFRNIKEKSIINIKNSNNSIEICYKITCLNYGKFSLNL